jgi:cyclin H
MVMSISSTCSALRLAQPPLQNNFTMNEDERYRTSTQYRLWSYTPESLANLREITNETAAERVREAINRAAESKGSSTANSNEASEAEQSGTPVPTAPRNGGVDCLTAEEELKLLEFYCRQTIDLGDFMKVPTEIKVCSLRP